MFPVSYSETRPSNPSFIYSTHSPSLFQAEGREERLIKKKHNAFSFLRQKESAKAENSKNLVGNGFFVSKRGLMAQPLIPVARREVLWS
jgi:hypothetical protein